MKIIIIIIILAKVFLNTTIKAAMLYLQVRREK